MTEALNSKKVIIIGGGLVGSLCGIFMARRGFEVSLYEQREDIRKNLSETGGRSINLAISSRGIQALSKIGLDETILGSSIKMKGRLLHDLQGNTKSVLYDSKNNQGIYSVGRNYLNQVLLTALETFSKVTLNFNHKLINVNFCKEEITLSNLITGIDVTLRADLIVGADGVFSTLRRAMQQTPLYQFSQTYIEHGYIELSIPPHRNEQMVPGHLHIWPRGEFMLIALPNMDKSWTVTLFMPFSRFDALFNNTNSNNDDTRLLDFFKTEFPDAVNLIGAKDIIETLRAKRPSPLLTVKCSPYHYGTRFVLIGDAAHAMVPFYGQGMNAGFEDCVLLDTILDEKDNVFGEAIEEFSVRRKEDAHAICDLAIYNYLEMRSLVMKRTFRVRHFLDELLLHLLPRDIWVPLYHMVMFSHLGYKECIKNKEWQDNMIMKFLRFTGLILILFFVFLLYKLLV